jgi:uncharacterized membrane protein HdeD (DUF308 family)
VTRRNWSWRDRLQIINSLLFCVAGGLLAGRFFAGDYPKIVLLLGVAFLGLGIYRLFLARREWGKRHGNISERTHA